MNRSRILARIAAAFAAVLLSLTALTGCPVVSSDDEGDDGDDEGDDYIHFSLVR